MRGRLRKTVWDRREAGVQKMKEAPMVYKAMGG